MRQERDIAINRFTVRFLIPAVIIVLLGISGLYFHRFNKSRLASHDADQKFELMIADAKNETSDPCGRSHVRLVSPPEHSTMQDVFVVGGREVSGDEIDRAITKVAFDIQTCGVPDHRDGK